MSSPPTVLWLSAHPESRSLSGALRIAGIDRLRDTGHAVVESDLYAMHWDPVVRPEGIVTPGQRFDVTADTRRAYLEGALPADVRREQRKIAAADVVVVQFPLWWYGLPAILKGWFDRVFVSGFAFGKDPCTGSRLRFEHGPFAGKRALSVVTLGDRARSIGPRGKSGELIELLFGLLHGTFAYTGMSALTPMAVPSADFLSPAEFPAVRRRLEARLGGIFDEQPIPYRPQFQGDYTNEWELAPEVLPGEGGLSVHLRR